MYKNIEEAFVKDTKNHTLNVEMDNGLYRHLVCSNNGSNVFKFGIVTWPGHLSIYGDMGSFTFCRLSDMFEFFGEGEVNLGYWSEKVVAENRDGGVKKFSVEMFREKVKDVVRSHLELDDDAEIPADVLESIEDVLNADDEHRCAQAIQDSDTEYFDDFWEYNCQEYDYNYVWCCHAIIWAIKKYRFQKHF